MSALPDRPVGIRRSWCRQSMTSSEAMALLVRYVPSIQEWGNPIEVQAWRKRNGALKRVEAVFANNRHVSFRRGTRTFTIAFKSVIT